MVQKVSEDPDIRMLDVHMPTSNPKIIHVYVLQSQGESLVVDTGMDWPQGRQDLEEGLKELALDFSHTKLFLTHSHSDHTGLSKLFTDRGCSVYMGKREIEYYRWYIGDEVFHDVLQLSYEMGVPVEKLSKAAGSTQKMSQISPSGLPVDYPVIGLEDGDTLQIGDLQLRTILSPGHTAGHMMLYLPERKVLFTGDHVLKGVTPIMDTPVFSKNPLKDYLESLENLKDLPVDLVLPGHGELGWNFYERLGELIDVHREELNCILSVLQGQPAQTAWEIVQAVRKMRGKYPWEKMPFIQQVLAAQEITPHLEYLQEEGKLVAQKDGVALRYSLS